MNSEMLNLSVTQEDNPASWDATVANLPYSHVLQSYQWGQFKSRHGWSVLHLVFRSGQDVRAAALVLKRNLPRMPWGIMYVPKGPLLDYGDSALLEGVLYHLERLARRSGALIIKIDPDVSFRNDGANWEGLQANVTAPAPPRCVSAQVIESLTRRGWRLSNEQVQFKNTLLIDLRPDEEELLARMKAKTRYNIRLAARKGVRVRPGSTADLRSFYRLYAETAERDNFLIRPLEYYHDAWGTFLQNDLADLLLAEWEGEILAGLILLRMAHKVWYMYGASSGENRNLMPNYLLQWEAIRLSKQKGCLLYDLWGAPDVSAPDDPLWGVYRFKQGLGGELALHIGAYDFPSNPILSPIYSWLLPHYVSFLQSRHRGPRRPLQSLD